MKHYAIIKREKYEIVETFCPELHSELLPNIQFKMIYNSFFESPYETSSLFGKLIASELCMSILPNVKPNNMVPFEWLYSQSYSFSMKYWIESMPAEFSDLIVAMKDEFY